jgi:hypothetical protein
VVRVGIGERALESFAPEDDYKPVFFAGFDDDLGVLDSGDFPGQLGAETLAFLGGNSARAAVSDDTLAVEGAEVGRKKPRHR